MYVKFHIILSITTVSHTEEYLKLQRKSAVLAEAIAAARCCDMLAMDLYSKKLISNSIYTEATTPAPGVTDITHAQIIIKAMLPKLDERIQGKENFDQLLHALYESDINLPEIVDGKKL